MRSNGHVCSLKAPESPVKDMPNKAKAPAFRPYFASLMGGRGANYEIIIIEPSMRRAECGRETRKIEGYINNIFDIIIVREKVPSFYKRLYLIIN